MKHAALVVALLVLGLQGPRVSLHPCLGALHAQEQPEPGEEDRDKLPKGEWCQRDASPDPHAHVCHCHDHDCKADPTDLQNRSAHTDPKCTRYCDVHGCRCVVDDCQ